MEAKISDLGARKWIRVAEDREERWQIVIAGSVVPRSMKV